MGKKEKLATEVLQAGGYFCMQLETQLRRANMVYAIFHMKRVNLDEERVWASWESNTLRQGEGPVGYGETMVEAIDDREAKEAHLATIDIYY